MKRWQRAARCNKHIFKQTTILEYYYVLFSSRPGPDPNPLLFLISISISYFVPSTPFSPPSPLPPLIHTPSRSFSE